MRKIKENQDATSDSVFKTTVAVAIALGAVGYLLKGIIALTQLWITSPSKKTTVELPFYMALRIVRKRGWALTEVEPVKHLSRWKHFKLAIGR